MAGWLGGCVVAGTTCIQPFRVQGSGFRVQGSGFSVQGSGFRVQGLGLSVEWHRGAEHLDAEHVQNNYFTEMCSGSEAGSYLRRIDFCITQL